jgi:hypothetical protein
MEPAIIVRIQRGLCLLLHVAHRWLWLRLHVAVLLLLCGHEHASLSLRSIALGLHVGRWQLRLHVPVLLLCSVALGLQVGCRL